MSDALLDVLRTVPLLAGCDAAELAAIASKVERREVRQGEELIREGEAASHLLLILKGEAVVHSGGVEVNRIKAGEFTGEMAALDGHHYTATVVAVTPMDILAVPAAHASRILEHQGVARRLMGRVVGWLRPGPPAPRPAPDTRRESQWGSITAAEQRVIDLVAAGRSNPQVAAELFISRYTVETHLKSVFSKLGISSRTELAVEAQRRSRSADS